MYKHWFDGGPKIRNSSIHFWDPFPESCNERMLGKIYMKLDQDSCTTGKSKFFHHSVLYFVLVILAYEKTV